MAFGREISLDLAERGLERFLTGKVEVVEHRPEGLTKAAWQVAEEFGWAKTYDAEYVALARLLGCRLVTVDGRLRRGTDRLGFVVGPAEL
jgi:predicted nucleic acid-binding protein